MTLTTNTSNTTVGVPDQLLVQLLPLSNGTNATIGEPFNATFLLATDAGTAQGAKAQAPRP